MLSRVTCCLLLEYGSEIVQINKGLLLSHHRIDFTHFFCLETVSAHRWSRTKTYSIGHHFRVIFRWASGPSATFPWCKRTRMAFWSVIPKCATEMKSKLHQRYTRVSAYAVADYLIEFRRRNGYQIENKQFQFLFKVRVPQCICRNQLTH